MDAEKANNWDQDEVIERWRKLFGGGVLLERYLAGQFTKQAELDKVTETVEVCGAHVSWILAGLCAA